MKENQNKIDFLAIGDIVIDAFIKLKNADVSIQNGFGETPLMRAVKYITIIDAVTIVQTIVTASPKNVATTDKAGNTVLHHIVNNYIHQEPISTKNPTLVLQCIQYLLNIDKNIKSIQNNRGVTAFNMYSSSLTDPILTSLKC